MLRALAPLLFVAAQSLQPAGAATTRPSVQFDGCALPVWPLPSLRAEHTGVVTLSYLVGEDGRVRESRVKKSSGHPALDLAAQEGIERCSFTPGTENGKPVTAWMDMQYVWTLEEDDPATVAQKRQEMFAAAERGDAENQLKLALAYFSGNGVQQDKALGAEWLLKSAQQGYAMAQTAMGELERERSGSQKAEAAMSWYRKAAEQDEPMSLFIVGASLIESGQAEQALEKLERSAEKGFPMAQETLGAILLDSDDADDQLRGFALLQKAAANAMDGAVFMLAECYATGKVVARDDAKAAKLYSEAAANGNVEAKIALAKLYQEGRGVNRNPERARRLLQEASAASKADAAPATRGGNGER